MPLEVEPAPTSDELAAILAVLQLQPDGNAPARPRTSRWRAAARAFDDGEVLRTR